MNKKTGTIAECLGLDTNSEEKYSQNIFDRCCVVLKEKGLVSDALESLAQWSKMERFFSEEELSDYEKELIFIGYTVGALIEKKKNEALIDIDSLSKLEKMVELMERAKKLKDDM